MNFRLRLVRLKLTQSCEISRSLNCEKDHLPYFPSFRLTCTHSLSHSKGFQKPFE